MKIKTEKLVIIALIVVVLALLSLIYKYHTTSRKTLSVTYPVEVVVKEPENEPLLYLYVFFSKQNCRDCLGIIEVLNILPPSKFVVKGVVPENELESIKDIRYTTGATFPIEGDSKFKKLVPQYTPAVVGLSKKSDLFFILPGVPGESEYLERFLNGVYQKVYSYLVTIE